MIHYIYKIKNLVNGKAYIGKHSTVDVNDTYFASGIAIQRAVRKYGRNSFVRGIICFCESEIELNRQEMFYINHYQSFSVGYNLTRGGEGKLGVVVRLESKAKQSASIRMRHQVDSSYRKRLSVRASLRTGNKNPFYGRKLSPAHIEKMTKSRILAISGEKNPSAVKVICINTNEVFNTASEAAARYGLKHSTTILKCCKGTRKTAANRTWRYA